MKKKSIQLIICFLVAMLVVLADARFTVPDVSNTVHAAETVKLNKKKVILIKGQTEKLKLRGAKGRVQWKSEKKSIASVSKNGKITARKKGKTKIYAKYKNKTYKCTVQVETPKLSVVSLILEVGQTENLKLNGTQQKVTWSTQNPEIVLVNEKGEVSAKKEGSTVITAKVGNKKYNCNVTVKAEPKTEVVPQKNWDIKMQVPGGRISTEHSVIPITITNNTDQQVSIQKAYKLDRNVDGQWEEVPMYERNWTTVLEVEAETEYGKVPIDEGNETNATVLEAGAEQKLFCDLGAVVYTYKLEPGKYRVRETVQIGNEQKELYAEFSIEQAVLDVEMKIVGNSTISESESSVSFIVQNNADNPISISNGYSLYMKENGEWVPAPLGLNFPADIQRIEAKGTQKFTCLLSDGEYKCMPGEYKVVRTMGITGQWMELSAEFTVKAEPKTEVVPQKNWDIKMQVPGGRISTEHSVIPITIKNNTDQQVSIQKAYKLDRNVDGQWEEVPMYERNGTTVLEAEAEVEFGKVPIDEGNETNATVLEAGAEQKLFCDLGAVVYTYKLEPGKYRVRETVQIGNEQKELYAEFSIEQAVLDVEMKIVGDSTISESESSVSFIVQNNADNPISIDHGYSLYMKENGEWVPAPLGLGFPADIHRIEAKGTEEFTCFLSDGEYKCMPGEYKVVRTMGTSEQWVELSAEFTIVE